MKLKHILGLALVVVAVIIFIQNTEPTTIELLFWPVTAARVVFLAGSLALGFVAGLLFCWGGRKSRHKNNPRPDGRGGAPEK